MTNAQVLFNYANVEGHRGHVIDEAGDYSLLSCETCNFRHVIPLPSEDELQVLYQDEFYEKLKPDYLSAVETDREWLELVYRERYEDLERLFGSGWRDILEMGCGPGLFLQVGMNRGWRVLGVEPSQKAAEYASKLGVSVVGTPNEPWKPVANSVDVVCLDQVLEHVRDPLRVLGVAKNMLRPGGIVLVVVPNDYNALQLELIGLGWEPWWISVPQHLNYFTIGSLSSLLQKVGFWVLEYSTTFPMELFLFMGRNYMGNEAIGKRCHAERKTFEQTLSSGLRRKLYKKLSELSIGREIVMYARKM